MAITTITTRTSIKVKPSRELRASDVDPRVFGIDGKEYLTMLEKGLLDDPSEVDTTMTTDEFWHLIDRSRTGAARSCEDHINRETLAGREDGNGKRRSLPNLSTLFLQGSDDAAAVVIVMHYDDCDGESVGARSSATSPATMCWKFSFVAAHSH